MQSINEDRLKHIEKVLTSSKELMVIKRRYGTNLSDALRNKLEKYNEFVGIAIAPKRDLVDLKQLVSLREGLMNKIGLATEWKPEVIFTWAGKNFGVTFAELIYSETLPLKRIVGAGSEKIEGTRDIMVLIYPNQAMAMFFAIPPAFTIRQIMYNSLDLEDRDVKILESSAKSFKITQQEKISHDFRKLKRQRLEQNSESKTKEDKITVVSKKPK